MTDRPPVLDGTDIDALVDVDVTGTVVACTAGAAEILGGATADLAGRDLFRDVAPAMATPACRGRFLQGVAAGDLRDAFTFVYGRETGSLQLRVQMGAGPRPGLFRIRLDVSRMLDPTRHREAMLAVGQRARSEAVDPIVCEQEPIHVPGSIQPPNGLLCLDPDTFAVTTASENVADLIGPAAASILGRPAEAVLPAGLVAALRADHAADRISRGEPERRETVLGEPPRPFAILAHLHDGRLVLEIEALPSVGEEYGVPTRAALRAAVAELRKQGSVADLAALAARQLRAMTGYERLLVYRFDKDWNGEAVGESIVEGWGERLLGLRFPASDIPRQARELYTRSPARFAVDRDAAPVSLVGSRAENRPVDLTFATIRTLSPIHIEYQRNLGVNGSMSVAIMVEGRLWGLVIGHHRRPHYIAPETRETVAVVVDALALLIQDREREAVILARNASFATAARLLGQIAGGDDLVASVGSGEVGLTDLFGATGAAVVVGGRVTTFGDAPPPALVDRLAEAIGPQLASGPVASAQLETLFPPMAAVREVASGLLAAAISAERGDLLMWFRPEIVRTVTWGGDPRKSVVADAVSSAILPRRSFERWVETQRGYSPVWAPWTLAIAENLAKAADGVTLRVSRRIAELSAQNGRLVAVLAQKDRLIADKDLLTREIDHRVKNSLQIVSAFLLMQARAVADPVAKAAFDDTYARVMSIARVHDSLYQSDTVTEVDLGQTIEALCRDLAGVGGESRDLDLVAETGLMVPYRKAVSLCLIATELVTNAWKYAYPGRSSGRVEVVVGHHDEGGLKLRVCDEGAGLPADWDRRERPGLGMKLVRTMLSQIEATMHVESERGTCFTVRF